MESSLPLPPPPSPSTAAADVASRIDASTAAGSRDVESSSVSPPAFPGPDRERNGSVSPATAAAPRLASLTGLIMNQKTPKWTSTSSSSDSSSAALKSPSAAASDSDQAVPSLTRTLRFDDEASSERRRTGSFGAASAYRRAAGVASVAAAGQSTAGFGPAGAAAGKGPGTVAESDLRRFVFHHPRAKRLVSGLRVHAFSRQAFVSSFTVGLAIGSVVAIVLKILKDVTCRMLYS